jgi:hypothetical protein
VKLEYQAGKGAGACRDEKVLRWQVRLREYYDPFEPDPEGYPAGVLRVEIEGTRFDVSLRHDS